MDTNLSILVCDDFATMRKIIKSCLTDLGFQKLAEAENGQLALAALHAQNFDLLITDLNMPVMDGMQLIKILRQEEKFKKLPIMVVTTDSSREKIMEAIEAGANSYLVKPFTAEILREKLSKLFDIPVS